MPSLLVGRPGSGDGMVGEAVAPWSQLCVVVLSLADYVTKLLEEGFQLLLLRWRQMLGDRRLAGLFGGGGRWRRISEGNDLQVAYDLSCV